MAIRIARAYSGRDGVAFCGYHGWHDWYLAANLAEREGLAGHLLPGLDPAGVPRGLLGTALPFRYNQIAELKRIVEHAKGRVGVVVMEPIRGQRPESGFLEAVRSICDDNDLVLIFDEVTAAFRMNVGGAHLVLTDVVPDIAVFGKALSNGYAMGAVIGNSGVMSAAEDTFISSTYWTERIGPTAALAMIRKFQTKNVHEKLISDGKWVQEIWKRTAGIAGVQVRVGGIEPLSHFTFETADPIASKTLFVQLMLERGFLATNAFYATYAHSESDLSSYEVACEEVFKRLAQLDASGGLASAIVGDLAHSGFARLT